MPSSVHNFLKSAVPLKLCGPSSTKNPSRRSERITPPARVEASSTSTSTPALRSAYPHTNPEMPAPTTIVLISVTTVCACRASRGAPVAAGPVGLISQRFREQRLRRELLLFEIGIKYHRQVANKNPPKPRRPDLFRAQQNQSVFARRFQARQLLREVRIEIHAKLLRDLVLHHHRVA